MIVPGALPPWLLFGLYCVPANSVVPLPHEPGLLYFAALASPLPLATAGAAGAFCAAYADRRLVSLALDLPIGRSLVATRAWRFATRLLLAAPFPMVFVTSLLGVPPIQAVRVLILSTSYPTRRYAAAVALGRFFRFFAIAALGRALAFPTWLLVAVTLLFVAWPCALLLRRREAT